MKTTHLAHRYWEEILKEGGTAIDATVGNGHDTLILARLLRGKGEVIGYDIQEKALEKARILLGEHLDHVTLHLASHEDFGSLRAKLIVYNLGYLPGGDKSLTTQTGTTLKSLQNALNVLEPGGALSIMCYPGHEEGQVEESAVLAWARALPSDEWSVCEHRWINRQKAPSLLLIWRQGKSI
jgi:16S rRNA C1402 N4-methylase RsmH